MQLAHFSQPRTIAGVLNHGSTAFDRNEERDAGSQRVLEERDKERDGFEVIRGNQTMKETLLAPLSGCSRLLLNSCSVPCRNQTACNRPAGGLRLTR